MPALKFSDITTAVAEQLRASVPYLVERGEYVNADPGIAVDGWVGVYRGALEYAPHTIAGRAFNVTGDVIVIVQAASAASGGDAEDMLELFLQKVIDGLESDKTFGGTVTILTGYSIEYSYASNDSGSLHMQWATIRAHFEKRIQL